jgi:pyruvate, orthophosphate dikinase
VTFDSERGRSFQAVYRIPCDGVSAETPTKEVVGSKAHNLMVMAQQGLPVPPAFVFGVDLCRAFLDGGDAALDGLEEPLKQELDRLGARLRRRFGDARKPLLVSVRSGAAVSMPGMMETVLNVGLTARAVRGLVRLTGNPRLAYDCRRRLIQQFAEVVHGADGRIFEKLLSEKLRADHIDDAGRLGSEDMAEIAAASLSAFENAVRVAFPEDPLEQLRATIRAVLASWSSERAVAYRRANGIDDRAGTAVIVQAMMFGNAGALSGSGVGFTRSPVDGSDTLYIDYLPNAQGEDVVAGRRSALGTVELELRAPVAFMELQSCKSILEGAFADMQDFEFTIEDGRLYFLQCRSGKRTPLAALRIACDLVAAGLIEPSTGLSRLEGVDLNSVGAEALVVDDDAVLVGRGVSASAGVVSGVAIFDPARIPQFAARGAQMILFRDFAETADYEALRQVAGLVTAQGARTSHAAVVARQLGKVCIVGCRDLQIDASGRGGRIGAHVLQEGDLLSIDGGDASIYEGALPVRSEKPESLLTMVNNWREEARQAAPCSG